MLDDPLLHHLLNHRPVSISEEAYRSWKSNPVTQQLLADISADVLGDLSSPLPDLPISDVGAHATAREAMREVAVNVFLWKPSDMEKEV